jgi:LysR family transcriptional regulator, nitrogen assimilation regulatory protein
VLADELDFAVVPTFEGRTGLKSRLIIRSQEMLLSSRAHGFAPLASIRLQDCAPLKMVLPGPDNVRRRNLEIYLQTHGVEVVQVIDMDAMIGTLEFVARTDWVTVLPGLICVNDINDGDLVVNPIDPPLFAEFVCIAPARRTLSTQARLFLEQFEAEVAGIEQRWTEALSHRTRPPDPRIKRRSIRRQ